MSRFPLRLIAIFSLAAAALAAAPPARADSGPVIVIPSRPGIPVIINGRDASYAVVEGDWGLSRPGAMSPTVIGGTPVMPSQVYTRRNSYHPRYGRAPERGRHEVEPSPDRALPDSPESFSRSWSTYGPPQQQVNDRLPPQAGEPAQPANAQSYAPGPDAVPPNFNDPQSFNPQSFNPPVIVMPRTRRH